MHITCVLGKQTLFLVNKLLCWPVHLDIYIGISIGIGVGIGIGIGVGIGISIGISIGVGIGIDKLRRNIVSNSISRPEHLSIRV